MVDIQEIRIGNHFLYKNKHIVQFSIEDFVEAYNNKQFLELFLNPIPLTEQWLIDFGARAVALNVGMYYTIKINDNLWFYSNINGNGSCTGEIECNACGNCNEEVEIIKDIECVHQLQNIYWCLCGEELTLNNQSTTE